MEVVEDMAVMVVGLVMVDMAHQVEGMIGMVPQGGLEMTVVGIDGEALQGEGKRVGMALQGEGKRVDMALPGEGKGTGTALPGVGTGMVLPGVGTGMALPGEGKAMHHKEGETATPGMVVAVGAAGRLKHCNMYFIHSHRAA